MLKQWNLVLMLGLVGNAATAQVPCVNGFAGEYPCENVELMSVMGTGEVGGGGMNDIWGWVDPSDSTEYVILGRSNGTAFIDISDPLNPLMVADLPTATTNSLWRDVKVHDNHAFIVSEAGGHGMQVVDLTQLGAIQNPPQTLTPDALYSGWGNAHNIVINEATARAYGVGTSTFSGGLHILDISDPTNPTLIGEFSGDGYTHDAQVVNYSGPDANYQGKEIAFCCNENTVTIVDVTDPMDATLISANSYEGVAYTHQGWLTEDQHYFITNDELDEQELGVNTTTFIWDVSDLAAPELIGTFVSEVAAIDHNMYVRDTLIYQSNYRAGLRVLSTGNIAAGELEEVGHFDLYPSSDAAQFNGTWSNYPYFPSGVIAVSHMEEGLFLLRLSGELSDAGCTDMAACNYDPSALVDDGSCLDFNVCGGCEGEDLFCVGCTDEDACNYTEVATIDDGLCFEVDAPSPQSAMQATEPVTFTAEPGTHWFDNSDAPEALAVAETYTLPLLAEDGSVWAAHSDGEFGATGGKGAPDFENGQHHPNAAYWLVFDVHEDAVLESVEVHSEQGGDQTVEILDANDNLVHVVTQTVVPGQSVLVLNAELPAGEDYQIRSGNEEPFLWRDDNGADVNFPYEVGGLASITGTTIFGENEFTYYYFFYNWTMSSLNPCLSERVEFTVDVQGVDRIQELPSEDTRCLLKTVDATGRVVAQPENQVVFHMFSDGSVVKEFVGDRR